MRLYLSFTIRGIRITGKRKETRFMDGMRICGIRMAGSRRRTEGIYILRQAECMLCQTAWKRGVRREIAFEEYITVKRSTVKKIRIPSPIAIKKRIDRRSNCVIRGRDSGFFDFGVWRIVTQFISYTGCVKQEDAYALFYYYGLFFSSCTVKTPLGNAIG